MIVLAQTTTSTTPALAVGTRFQITDARRYTDNGVRGVHVVTLLATVTAIDDRTVEYVAEPVDETSRPSFAPRGGVRRGTALLSAIGRYFDLGEWQPLPTPARPLADVLGEHVAEVNYRRLVTAIGGGFHPDTRGDDYVTLPAGITADMVDQTIDAALVYDLDVYAIALDVII
jgi:hypothetical protein